MTKRQKILQYIIDNGKAEIRELMEEFDATAANIRQNITYLRQQGNLITTTGKRREKCFYSVDFVAKPKESICSKIRTILATGDEWETKEIADMCGVKSTQVSNMIGDMRRAGKINIKTIKLGHNRYAYQAIQD